MPGTTARREPEERRSVRPSCPCPKPCRTASLAPYPAPTRGPELRPPRPAASTQRPVRAASSVERGSLRPWHQRVEKGPVAPAGTAPDSRTPCWRHRSCSRPRRRAAVAAALEGAQARTGSTCAALRLVRRGRWSKAERKSTRTSPARSAGRWTRSSAPHRAVRVVEMVRQRHRACLPLARGADGTSSQVSQAGLTHHIRPVWRLAAEVRGTILERLEASTLPPHLSLFPVMREFHAAELRGAAQVRTD